MKYRIIQKTVKSESFFIQYKKLFLWRYVTNKQLYRNSQNQNIAKFNLFEDAEKKIPVLKQYFSNTTKKIIILDIV